MHPRDDQESYDSITKVSQNIDLSARQYFFVQCVARHDLRCLLWDYPQLMWNSHLPFPSASNDGWFTVKIWVLHVSGWPAANGESAIENDAGTPLGLVWAKTFSLSLLYPQISWTIIFPTEMISNCYKMLQELPHFPWSMAPERIHSGHKPSETWTVGSAEKLGTCRTGYWSHCCSTWWRRPMGRNKSTLSTPVDFPHVSLLAHLSSAARRDVHLELSQLPDESWARQYSTSHRRDSI